MSESSSSPAPPATPRAAQVRTVQDDSKVEVAAAIAGDAATAGDEVTATVNPTESGAHSLELSLTHLSVTNSNARLGNQRLDFFCGAFNGGHFIVQEVNLTTAENFPQHGFFD